MSVLIKRPSGAGALTELNAIPGVANWNNVKEAIADSDSSYNYYTIGEFSSANKRDKYTLDGATFTTETIDAVKIYVRWTRYNGGVANIILNDGVADYESTPAAISAGGTYATDTFNYALNPRTSAAWTAAQVNALQLGVRFNMQTDEGEDFEMRVTQIYAEITYTAVAGAANTGFFGMM